MALAMAALTWQVPRAGGQEGPPPAGKAEAPIQTAERRKALEMSYEHRALEALPLLEALARANPADAEVRERLAVSLIAKTATVRGEESAALMRRARAILLDLKKSGKASGLGEILAEAMPADGADLVFSSDKEIQAAMREGENAFVRREYGAAREAYRRALKLDPRLYQAALFVGDTYFAEKEFSKARNWFARAILIDPNHDAAHRYLGDAQMELGDVRAARISYLDGVIAVPYTRRTWLKVEFWGKENGVRVGHPRIIPGDLAAAPDAKGDRPQADDGRAYWRLYAEARAAWAKGRFKTTFPREAAYRHSLAEEADALRQVARKVASDLKSGKLKGPDPSLAILVELDEEGLLEAYVLYALADEGIAQDYEPYRAAHRGELRRYLSRYVLPTKEAPGPAKGI